MTRHALPGLQPPLGAAEKDEVYYWDTVRFLVEGVVFKLPRYQFAVGSEYFEKTYFQNVSRCLTPEADPDDDWDSMDVTDAPRVRISTAGAVHLEGVTAVQFRTFLKLLFPMHSTTTTLTLTKAEWFTILTLSTRWHFFEFRKLAMEHLDTEIQVADAVEMVIIGRAEYVSKWVEGGYEKLVVKEEAISEEESERIGWRMAVKLYIVRHKIAVVGKGTRLEEVKEAIQGAFLDELAALKRRERDMRTREEIRIEEEQDDLKHKEEGERIAQEEEEEERASISETLERAREEPLETETVSEEKAGGEEGRRQEEHQDTHEHNIEEDRGREGQRRQSKKAAKKAKKGKADQKVQKGGTTPKLTADMGQDETECPHEKDTTNLDDVIKIIVGERDDKAQEQRSKEEGATALQKVEDEDKAAVEKKRREAEREALIQQKLEEELEMIMADTKK